MSSLSIYGTGKIGGETAYLATVMNLVDRLVIADCVEPFLNAQYLDLIHTGADTEISKDPSDITDSDVILFAAGFARTPEVKTRADLLNKNIPVAKGFCDILKKAEYDGIVVTVTNPMDAMNYYIGKNSGLPREKCLGFGGQLDLARLRIFLKNRGFDPTDAWCMGEHGEFQVPIFSGMGAKGTNTPNLSDSLRDEIQGEMRGASMPIIKGKGGTVFGPVYHISKLIEAVLKDKKEVLPCSCLLNGEYGYRDISMCVPARIGKDGFEEILEWELDAWESERMNSAADHLIDLCGRA